ncbi:MAG: TolC family protein [Robiginitomaculum sp.]|nr:TolC family protein [Robiginitomaculum sp.]
MSKFKQGALCVLIATAFSGAAIAAPCDGPTGRAPVTQPGAPLTLDLALAQVRYAAPDVRRAALEIRARSADADQAGRRLNPSIGLEVENFSGSGALNGFNQAETTLTFAQTFQLGGKRTKRERAARANAVLAAAECQAILREVELQAALLFYDLLAAQELAAFASESADLAISLFETVGKRVEAGAAAPPELSRARADAAILRAATLAVNADVDQRRYDLAMLWGSASPEFAAPRIDQARLAGLSSAREGGITSHPALAVAKASTNAREAERVAARVAGLPDLTVSAGVRQFEETGDQAFLVSINVPLPLFDRNQDAARAAGYRADAARVSGVAIEARLRSRQQAAIAQVRAADARLSLLEREALPAARSAYEASVQGYAAGRFDLTSTLDARKGLIEAGVAVIDANRTLNADMMKLKSLIGAAPFDGDLQ